jgi:hypothetical protein
MLLLRFYQAAPGYDAGAELDSLAKHTPALKEISGLGDKARATGGAASALPPRTVMLYVVNKNALLTIGLSGLDDETEALENAKNLARKILLQL